MILLFACSAPVEDTSPVDTEADADTDTDTDADTDTDTDADTDVDVRIQAVGVLCDGHKCIWTVTTTGLMGGVTLDLVLTGDPDHPAEQHTTFTRRDYDGTYETKALYLEHVHDGDTQTANVSTEFDPSFPDTAAALSVQFRVNDASEVYADCGVYGHDVTWFAKTCTNEISAPTP